MESFIPIWNGRCVGAWKASEIWVDLCYKHNTGLSRVQLLKRKQEVLSPTILWHWIVTGSCYWQNSNHGSSSWSFCFLFSGHGHGHGHGMGGMGGLLAGAAAAYGAHHLVHARPFGYGHGKFKHGKFGKRWKHGGKFMRFKKWKWWIR